MLWIETVRWPLVDLSHGGAHSLVSFGMGQSKCRGKIPSRELLIASCTQFSQSRQLGQCYNLGLPSSKDTNFSDESHFIGRLYRFPSAEVQRFYFRHGSLSSSRSDRKEHSDVHSGSLPRCVGTDVRLQAATVCTRGCPVMRRETPIHYTSSSALLFDQINRFGGIPSLDFSCWLMGEERAQHGVRVEMAQQARVDTSGHYFTEVRRQPVRPGVFPRGRCCTMQAVYRSGSFYT